MIEQYQTVEALLASKSRWGQMRNALDKNGKEVSIHSPQAERFCLIGALQRVYVGERWYVKPGFLALENEIKQLGFSSVVVYNDTHNHAEVLALVRKHGL